MMLTNPMADATMAIASCSVATFQALSKGPVLDHFLVQGKQLLPCRVAQIAYIRSAPTRRYQRRAGT